MQLVILAAFLSGGAYACDVEIGSSGSERFYIYTDGEPFINPVTGKHKYVYSSIAGISHMIPWIKDNIGGQVTLERDQTTAYSINLKCKATVSVDPPIDPEIVEPPVVVIPPIVPDPPIDPDPVIPPYETPVVMYSYTADMADALPLQGSVLRREMIFISAEVHDTVDFINFYCCKIGTEPHQPPQQHTFMFDGAAALADDGGPREVYFDIILKNGTLLSNNFTTFSLEPKEVGEAPVVTLQWDAPTQREDTTPLPVEQLAGFFIEYGLASSEERIVIYVTPGTATEYTLAPLSAQGEWKFRAAALDTTPDVECTEESEDYTCGGPLKSEWSEWVSMSW